MKKRFSDIIEVRVNDECTKYTVKYATGNTRTYNNKPSWFDWYADNSWSLIQDDFTVWAYSSVYIKATYKPVEMPWHTTNENPVEAEEMQEAPVETIENEIIETVETENGDIYIIETNKGYQGNIETYLLKKNGRIIYESYKLNEVLDYMNGRIYAGDIQQEYTSAETSVNDKKIPVVFSTLINKADKLNIRLDMTSIFDTGCGKYINHISEYCSKNLVRYFGRDKYNQPEEVNNAWINDIYGVYLNDDNHIFTSSNVLNVIKGENCRKQYINDIVKYMQAGEKLYITVYEGNKTGRGKVTKKDCWQENKRLATYIPEVKSCGFSEVTMKYGMIIATL